MTTCCPSVLCVLPLTLALGVAIARQSAQDAQDASEAERLIKQLGSTKFNVVGRQIQIGGALPGNAAQVLNVLNGEGGDTLRLFDAQDRPYTLTVSESAVNRANGVSVATYTLDCKPAGDGAKPRRLELHGPRRASVEAKFTLRDVPLP
jgi:hypothetical protein